MPCNYVFKGFLRLLIGINYVFKKQCFRAQFPKSVCSRFNLILCKLSLIILIIASLSNQSVQASQVKTDKFDVNELNSIFNEIFIDKSRSYDQVQYQSSPKPTNQDR